MSSPEKRPAFESADRLLIPPQYDAAMKRPFSTTAGVVIVLLRVVAGGFQAFEVAAASAAPGGVGNEDASADDLRILLIVLIAGVAIVLAVVVALAVLIYLGWNLPRVIVMVFVFFSIVGAFIGWWAQGQQINLQSGLVALALDILVLLALSSRGAAAYARRRQRG